MLVEFSVKNFRSIKEMQTLSFVATKLNSNSERWPEVDENNIVEEGEYRLLKTIGLYGANASGKSNIIRALEYFYSAIYSLPSPTSRLSALADPFLFQDDPEDTESFFQLVVLYDGKKYRYGFTVKKNLSAKDDTDSKEIITNEWLYGPRDKNQVKYFIRKDLEIDKEGLHNAKNIPDIQFSHTLFLTHAAAFDKAGICNKLRHFIGGFMISNYAFGTESFRFHTIEMIEKNKHKILEFLSSFNLNYSDIIIEKDDKLEKGSVFPQNKIYLKKYGILCKENRVLNLRDNESEGTKKIFDLLGLLIHAFNTPVSGLIVLDEIDSNFHPSLVIRLIKMFNDKTINTPNVQLIFTSHDTNLLDPSLMRRDQFYFTEKDMNDSTRLYSLSSLKGIRNDADFARQYLAGFYGAIPIISNYFNNNIVSDGRAMEY